MIQEQISSQKHIELSYCKTWKAKQIVLARVYENWEESYDLLNS